MSDSSSGARNHHHVPQCYLKGFAKPRSKEGKLTVFDMKTRKSFQTRPRNVAAVRDYNRVDIPNVDPNFVETQLAIFESDLDRSIRRIVEARSIDNANDRNTVLALVARLFVAGPHFRGVRDKFMSDIADKMMRNIVATPERWHSASEQVAREVDDFEPLPYETMRDAVMEGRITPRTSREALIEQEMKIWPEIMPYLTERSWLLFVARPDAGDFATSDRPCTLRNSQPDEHMGIYGIGLGMSRTDVIFPLTRHLALLGRFEGGGGILEADRRLVAAVNVATLMTAERQLYAAEDFPITDDDGSAQSFSASHIWRERICNRPSDSD